MLPSPLRSTVGRPNRFRESIFSVCGALSCGAAPLLRACTFSIFLLRRMTDPLRLLSRPMVQTFLSDQNIFNGARLVDVVLSGVLLRFLMMDGYWCRLWYCGQPFVCNLCSVQGHRSANCPNKDKYRKCEKTGHFARNCTPDGPAGDSADFPPLASSSEPAEASVSRGCSDSQLLKDNELDLLQSQSILQDLVLSVVILRRRSPTKGPLKESGKTRAHLPKGVILFQALLSIFLLPTAKSLTLL